MCPKPLNSALIAPKNDIDTVRPVRLLRSLRSAARAVTGVVVGLYLLFLLLLNLPPVQTWIATAVGKMLSEKIGSRVEVRHVDVSLTGGLVVDGLTVWDRTGEETLRASRLAVKLDVGELLSTRRIRIDYAQLMGTHANLYQPREGAPLNIQYIIDAFASKDTTRHPIDLAISRVVIRRSEVRYERRWKQPTPGRFNADYLHLTDLNLTASLHKLRPDTVDVSLSRLSCKEACGLTLEQLKADVLYQNGLCSAKNVLLQLPDTRLATPSIEADIARRSLSCPTFELDLTPQDIAPLVDVPLPLHLRAGLNGSLDDLYIPHLQLSTTGTEVEGAFRLTHITSARRTVEATLRHLYVGEDILPVVGRYAKIEKLRPTLHALRYIDMSGRLTYNALGTSRADVKINTARGRIEACGSYGRSGIQARLTVPEFDARDLGGQGIVGRVSAEVEVESRGTQLADLRTAKVRVRHIEVKGYDIHNITADVQLQHLQEMAGRVAIADPSLRAAFEGRVLLAPTLSVEGKLDAPHIDLDATRLLPRRLGRTFALEAQGHVKGHTLEDLEGQLDIAHFAMTDRRGTLALHDIHLTNTFVAASRHLTLESPYLDATLTGEIQPKSLAASLQRMAHVYLPSYFDAPAGHYAPSRLALDITTNDLSPLWFFLGRKLHVPSVAHLEGNIDTQEGEMALHAVVPSFDIDSTKTLRDIDLTVNSTRERMHTLCTLEAKLGAKTFGCDLNMQAAGDQVEAQLRVDNTNLYGQLALAGRISREANGRPAFDLRLQPTTWHIGDKLGDLSLTHAHLRLANNLLTVDSLGLQRDSIYLLANGVVPLTGGAGLQACGTEAHTSEPQAESLPPQAPQAESLPPQLLVDFGGIDIEQIMTLAGVKPVKLSGSATGQARVYGLPNKPVADLTLYVPHFLFNDGYLGHAVINGSWGRIPDKIGLEAVIADTTIGARTTVSGAIAPYKAPRGRIDLDFTCHNTNFHFINRYTQSIFSRAEGTASGTVGVHGQFGQIDLSGDILCHRIDVSLPFTGVSYHLEEDSVHLRPEGVIEWTDATIYDAQGAPGRTGHQALISGTLRHRHFKNMTYDVRLKGQNILAYDFGRGDTPDLPFFGTIYGTGDVHVAGRSGAVNIDIEATPQRGSSIEYNVRRPDAITQNTFLTIGTRDSVEREPQAGSPAPTVVEAPSSNMNINFTLDVTPDLDMRLLMDASTQDYITVRGSGPIHANYYNKGGFTMYGDYTVESGSYQLNIASIAQKRVFRLVRGGTVAFTGAPYDADINLSARYDVPSRVALRDLSSSNTFSDNKVPVACLVDISGQLRALQLGFDIDLPNATEDERQLVRSQISTEEERYTQFIYLLALGRFYTFDYAGEQQQTVTALNSILSSTLSSQINQVLSSVIGSNKWSFGANLSTGDNGWKDMDVEGQLTGSLFNDRLIVNGNVGYRDRMVNTTNTNFVGDFDARYLLTKNGNLSIKAYSETNDRYFTRSALTTQGIGFMAKKDFSTWKDLFTTNRKKKKKK